MTVNDIHQWVEERLSEYLDKQLVPADLVRLEAHLRECDRCSASLESLRQTILLLKHAPVPAPSRQFTLPVTRSERRPLQPSFAFLRVATVLATLVLCAVVSFDMFGPLRFAAQNSAPAQFAAPVAAPTNIALAPTSAPAATSAAAPTLAPTTAAAAPKPTSAPPQAAAQPLVLPTGTRAINLGASEAQATTAAADQALKSSVTAVAPLPLAPRAAITGTLIIPSPSPTAAPSATLPAPTATTQFQARAEATRVGKEANDEIGREIALPLRLLEFGLVALVIILAALTIFAGRRK